MNKYILLSIICLFSLNSFGQVSDFSGSTRAYYFPYKTFFKPHSYKFVNTNDSTDVVHWVLETKRQRKDTLLYIVTYDQQNRPLEKTVQQLTADAVILKEYKAYNYLDDTVIEYNCTIHDSLVFRFNQVVDQEFQWAVSFTEPRTTAKVIFRKSRILAGQVKHSGDLKFKDDYYFNFNGEDLLDHQVSSYFSLDQGLTSYSIITNEALTRYYKLVEVTIPKKRRL